MKFLEQQSDLLADAQLLLLVRRMASLVVPAKFAFLQSELDTSSWKRAVDMGPSGQARKRRAATENQFDVLSDM